MIDNLLERFNSLTEREKIICLATFSVLVWALWNNFLYEPIDKQQQQMTSEIATLEVQLAAQRQAAVQIENLGKIDINQANKQQLATAKSTLKQLKENLNAGDKQFVPAHLMVTVLSEILKQNNGLKLIHLESLPVKSLPESESEPAWIFLHGLSLTVRGDYFNTINYLKSLESQPWRFNWDNIHYQVIDYPIAETTLQVYTLSFEENWLGL